MSKLLDVARIAGLAAVSFWLGSQPIFMGWLAYHKLWLGEGQGYEGGLVGFLGGMFIWALFLTPLACVWFGAVLIGLMLSRKMASENARILLVFSGILGLACSLFIMAFVGIDAGTASPR
ncbi:MAG: hypothetical protein BWX88_03020 [Planctomycetes bacterium ADurb.Bin126]|nr:MAG: hypothetical protein BWX88_03020 [Planctomycetes bacterium ADurb.Bin126]HOD84106.1 hypothetical protein [Phycisphaerae bacterium]HQL75328.1 hypothetical protein [Phycisphaerae bacterium]